MTLSIPFDNSYSNLPDRFYARVAPTAATNPKLLSFNEDLAKELGVTGYEEPDTLADVFSGSSIPDGAEPIAQAYAGHQFGNFVPQLGDGRAHLLGEVVDAHGQRRDIQLKGSGRTPFSRGGDGKAWIGPVLREYLVSEAMHALGIPTTRALAAATTGGSIMRQEGMMPAAVLTRVAASHIRVGTFQYFAVRQDVDALQQLFDYSVARHDPDAGTPYDFLKGVIERQVNLITQWMGIGFIHGVMNTDNTSISGETIDFGPCAFMDRYHPATVFSSIDRNGRYAFANQPEILIWNMAQLASALVPLEANEEVAVNAYTIAVHKMPDMIRAAWLDVFRKKLGLSTSRDTDGALVENLLGIMAANDADFTNTFRGLIDGTARDHFLDPSAYDRWEADWRIRLEGEPEPEKVMSRANPAFIPRNHRIEEVIQSALNEDMTPFHRLKKVLATPYENQPDASDLSRAPLPDEEIEATFCGT